MSEISDWMLDQHIIVTVADAMALDEPITIGRGPLYDRRLKRALKLSKVHQSLVCSHVKAQVELGILQFKQVGTHTMYLGEQVREYPVVQLLST